MIASRIRNAALAGMALVMISACANNENIRVDPDALVVETGRNASIQARSGGGSLFDAFRGGNTEIKVNRFLWTASLEVLNFLPVTAADPFTGVITTGYGTPPGGGRAYRATILISDPALDARSLNVALQTSSGPVAIETQRAVEDAILNRARQLRISAGRY